MIGSWSIRLQMMLIWLLSVADDLYTTLGIDRSASKAEVTRAWKRRVKKAHPDGGGSAEEFKRVQTAHLILADDAKRARYDATGEFEETQPDIEFAQILEGLSIIIDVALGNLMRANREATQSDLLSTMLQVINDHRQEKHKEKANFKAVSDKWEKIVDRFSTDDGPNYIDQIVRGKITQLGMMIATADQHLDRLKKIEILIKKYKYRRDPLPEGPTTVTFGLNHFAQTMLRGERL
jgi:curved DNA-binding protein CbpA